MKRNKVRLGYVNPETKKKIKVFAAKNGMREEEVLEKLLDSIGDENETKKKLKFLDI